jgi:hypothetical protein
MLTYRKYIYMPMTMVRRVACTVTVGAIAAACLGSAPAADAASAVVRVPCSSPALSGDLENISSGETLRLAARCVYQLATALPAITTPLVIKGNGATLEPRSAPAAPAFTLLEVNGGTLTVSNLNFRNGDGGISVTGEGQLTVNGGTFTGNTGAIDSTSQLYSPVVNGAFFIRNRGAISNDSAFSSVVVYHCTFVDNAGGAIWEFGLGGSMTDSIFRGNTAQSGGALYLNENFNEQLSGDIFLANSSTEDGGAIYNNGNNGNGVIIVNSKIYGNRAGGEGGGLYALGPSTSYVTDTAIERNRAPSGGGIESAGDIIVISDSTISGNRASANGGGIGNGSAYAGLSLTDSTILGNRAGEYGGGIFNQGEVDATGTQIVGNWAVSGGGIYNDGASFTVSLATSSVLYNEPDNCEPAGSVTGCANKSGFRFGSSGSRACTVALYRYPDRNILQANPSRRPVSEWPWFASRAGRPAGHPPPGHATGPYCLTGRLAERIMSDARRAPGSVNIAERAFSHHLSYLRALARQN